MDADFCVTALAEAMVRFGRPEIFNTDQGSQFTSFSFTNALKAADIRISMDGRGRWMDNVFFERLWRSLKYECVYLNAFETGSEARTGIGRWIGYYNADRPHSVFGGRTPAEVYATQATEEKLDQKGRRRGFRRIHDCAPSRSNPSAGRAGCDHARCYQTLRRDARAEADAR
jgi:putative transposase